MSAPVVLVRAPAPGDQRLDLTPGERCDRCGARAFVATAHRVDDELLTLAWCAHHWTQLERSGALDASHVVADHRGQLVPR